MVDDDSESNPVGTLEGMEIIHDEEGGESKDDNTVKSREETGDDRYESLKGENALETGRVQRERESRLVAASRREITIGHSASLRIVSGTST